LPEPKKKEYLGVNVPREWEPFLNEALENVEIRKKLEIDGFSKTYSGLGSWIIKQFLLEKTSFHLQHFNTYEDHATIIDNKLRRMIDISIRRIGEREFDLFCQHCEKTTCEHVKFALTVPEIMEHLKKKGLKYKGE